MINSLSILIPTYNNVCLELVRDLQAQASILSSTNDLEYEILVADDGSTDKNTIEKNREINELNHCQNSNKGFGESTRRRAENIFKTHQCAQCNPLIKE